MKKNSRKTLKKRVRARTDHPAGCRISDDERTRLLADVAAVAQASGMAVSLGAYTKHALLSHARYRRMEVELRKLVAEEAVESYFAGEEPAAVIDAAPMPLRNFYNGVKQILLEAR